MRVYLLVKPDRVYTVIRQSGPLGDFFGNSYFPKVTEIAELLRLRRSGYA